MKKSKKKSKIWSQEVDDACHKYFIEGVKDEELFTSVIYPSLQYTARWQIGKCVKLDYIPYDREELEQMLICDIMEQLPKYKKEKKASWFSFAGLWMSYYLSIIANRHQCKNRDIRKTLNITDDMELERILPREHKDNSIVENKEFVLSVLKWWRENRKTMFSKTNKSADDIIQVLDDLLKNKPMKFNTKNGLGRYKLLPSHLPAERNDWSLVLLRQFASINQTLYKNYEKTGKVYL